VVREIIEGHGEIRIECCWSVCCKFSTELDCLLNCRQSILSTTQIR
jgi:hypothetical protein